MSASLVELTPGDVAFGHSGDQFKTLLGSCVSVIMTDPRRTVAVMCHIVHVGQPNAANSRNTAYGVPAMDAMFSRLYESGFAPSLCQAYVFGGGNMFPQLFTKRHVGASNVAWVLDCLAVHGIAVVDQCLGGDGWRKLSWTVGPTQPLVEIVWTEQGSSDGR